MRVMSMPMIALVVILTACGSRVESADIVLRGGVVRTMEAAATPVTASSVAVRGGRIVHVGGDQDASALIGPETEVVELEGRLVLPGFHDTHVHALDGGIAETECDLRPAASRDQLVRVIGECVVAAGPAPWLRGGGYDPTLFPGGEPPRELLDSLVSDRPAYLTDATEHAAWVNSRALAAAGIDARTSEPSAGVIVRRADGSPQGTLREGAMQLVAGLLPPRTDAELEHALERGLAIAASLGITTLYEAAAEERTVRAYAAVEADGSVTARARLFVLAEPGRGGEQAQEIAGLRDRYGGALVQVAGAKIFLDGVLEGGTAALLEPYLGPSGGLGELRWPSPDSLAALVGSLEAAGLTAHFHAIGDRAVRAALDAVERARATGGGAIGARHVVAHAQLIDPIDLPRLAALGVVVSFQPLWAQRDAYITELTEPRVGAERSSRLYPIRSVLATGAVVAAGSDWPVTSMDPLDAIEVAVTRRNEMAAPGEPWLPAERITVEEAVGAYTRGAAHAGGLQDRSGVIGAGMLADLVVLDRDIFTIDPTEISEARVDLTLLEGRVVFRRPPG
jgi:predicted amidohydrolase YtcJ